MDTRRETVGYNIQLTHWKSQETTDNIPTIVQTLEEIYPLLNERSIKNKMYRLCKKLTKPTDTFESSFSCISESDIEFS